jgi:18S rRNA (guanine1575-N7)-methyltransferase
MSQNHKTPKFPDSYVGDQSKEYNNSIWMERNQKKTTLLCIQYLFDIELDKLGTHDVLEQDKFVILDLGCGTGFSSEMIALNGYRVIGIDILPDMIYYAKKNLKIQKHKDINFILASINQLPLRNDLFNHAISVSAYNFITYGQDSYKDKTRVLRKTAKSIFKLLKPLGRFIIEFYPKDEKELNLFLSSFKDDFDGFFIKNNPNQKAGQTFLLLKKR